MRGREPPSEACAVVWLRVAAPAASVAAAPTPPHFNNARRLGLPERLVAPRYVVDCAWQSPLPNLTQVRRLRLFHGAKGIFDGVVYDDLLSIP
jgi:hypothetical protein